MVSAAGGVTPGAGALPPNHGERMRRRVSRRRHRALLAVGGLACLWCGGLPTVSAQRVIVYLEASVRRLTVGETLQLKLTATVESETPISVNLPVPEAFQMLSWEVQRPTSVRVGPGGHRRVTQRYVDWRVLRAERPGRWTLGPAEVFVGGRTVRSAPVRIQVLAGSAPTPTPATPGPAPRDGGIDGSSDGGTSGRQAEEMADAARFDERAFLRTVASVGRPFVGQAVEVSVFLYAAAPLGASPLVEREPSTDGFWVQDLLPPSRQLRPSRQVVRGRPFYVYELRRFVAQPVRTGLLHIGAPRVEVRLAPRSIDDLFGGLFGGRVGGESLHLEGEPLALQVRPLPDPKRARVPVGRFGATLSVRPERLDASGGAALLTLEVEGDAHPGDLKPPLTLPRGLRSVRETLRDEVRVVGRRLSVRRRMTWTLEPERPGHYELGPVAFDVFEPDSGRYVRVQSGRTVLDVAASALASRRSGARGGAGTGGARSERGASERGADPLDDLGKWPDPPHAWLPPASSAPPPWFAWAWAACLAVGGLLGLWRGGRGRSRKGAVARSEWRRLKAALGELERGARNDASWLLGLERVLWEMAEVALGEPVRALDFETLARRADERLGAGCGERLVALLREVEALRFGADAGDASNAERREDLLRRARASLAAWRAAAEDKSRRSLGSGVGLLVWMLATLSIGAQALRAEEAEHGALSSLWREASEAYAQGRWEDAAVQVSELARLAFHSPEVWRAVGLAEARAGRLGASRAALLRALRIDPSNTAAASDLRRVVAALRAGGPEGADEGDSLGPWDWGRPWPPVSRMRWPWLLLGLETLWSLLCFGGIWGVARRAPSLRRRVLGVLWVSALAVGGAATSEAMAVGPWVERDAAVLVAPERLQEDLWAPSEPGKVSEGTPILLPEGAVVHLGEAHAASRWVVTAEGLAGWVPSDSVASLEPTAPWPLRPSEEDGHVP